MKILQNQYFDMKSKRNFNDAFDEVFSDITARVVFLVQLLMGRFWLNKLIRQRKII